MRDVYSELVKDENLNNSFVLTLESSRVPYDNKGPSSLLKGIAIENAALLGKHGKFFWTLVGLENSLTNSPNIDGIF